MDNNKFIDSMVEESKKEVSMPERKEMDLDANKKPMQPKFTSKDYGNVRVYPNETGSNMSKDNKWIGKRYNLMEAHNLNDDYLKKNLVGKTKSGADVYKMPDGYFSGNPRINDASFKNVQDLEDFEKKSGEHRAAMKEGTYLDDYIKNYKEPKPIPKADPAKKLMSVKSVRDAVIDDTLKDTKVNKDIVKKAADAEFKQEQPKPWKFDKMKYQDVEETPYGFIYNIGGQSITDVAGQKRAFGEPIEEGKEYGFTRTTDSGDEVFHKSFDDAYKAINKEKINKEYENDMDRRDKRIKSYTNEDGIDDMKTAASYLANAPHEFEELSSELVNRIESVKDKGKLEDIIFENLQMGDSYEEAVENALENFKDEKKEFDLNYFEEAGEKDLGLSQVQTAIGRQLTMEEYEAFIYPKMLKFYDEYKDAGYDRTKIEDEMYDAFGNPKLIKKVFDVKEPTLEDYPIDDFDINEMDVRNSDDRVKMIKFYLTDMWGYDPEEIRKFGEEDIEDTLYGINGNINRLPQVSREEVIKAINSYKRNK